MNHSEPPPTPPNEILDKFDENDFDYDFDDDFEEETAEEIGELEALYDGDFTSPPSDPSEEEHDDED